MYNSAVIHRFLSKLNGWPSAALGAAVLASIAFYGFQTFQKIEAEKVSVLAELDDARVWNYELLKVLQEKEATLEAFQGQIGDIASTVGILDKLSKTDEELLKKYSKIYFLNENYIPSKLTEIPTEFLHQGSTNFQIHTDVWPYLEKLIKDAQKDEVDIKVASAFRSFDTQSSLKANYKVLYGSGANQFSADQGYSEHQLGTAVDLTTPKLGAALLQSTDPAYKWLEENAHNYGFILSYPSGNTYYKFEPWHWRYVGVALATNLYEDRKHFYDLDQREIDAYLIKLFE